MHVQVLDLPPSLLSAQFCRPLLQRAHERLVACYADLEAAWTDAVGNAMWCEPFQC